MSAAHSNYMYLCELIINGVDGIYYAELFLLKLINNSKKNLPGITRSFLFLEVRSWQKNGCIISKKAMRKCVRF